MKKITFLFVAEEYVEYFLKDAFFDHVVDRHRVFSLHNCLEKFDHLDVRLNRVVIWAICHFHEHFVVDEKVAQLVRIHIVNNQFVQELQNQDPALVNLLLESSLDLWI